MFKMTIEGATLAALGTNLALAAQQFGTTVPEGKPETKTTTRKKAEPAATEPKVDTETPAGMSDANAPVDKGKLQKDCMTLSQKSGASALAELFNEFGAAKWGDIPEDKYPALQARLDDLLAPAE